MLSNNFFRPASATVLMLSDSTPGLQIAGKRVSSRGYDPNPAGGLSDRPQTLRSGVRRRRRRFLGLHNIVRSTEFSLKYSLQWTVG